jgi:hypothetical protein
MKFSEVLNEGRDLSIIQLDRSEIRLLWCSEYYDAPISGMLIYHRRPYYFRMHEAQKWMYNNLSLDEQDWSPPKYLVIQLTDEQLAEEEKWHKLSLEKIGNGSDYAEDQLSIAVHHPELHLVTGNGQSIKEYWDMYRKEHKALDLAGNEVIGWFNR